MTSSCPRQAPWMPFRSSGQAARLPNRSGVRDRRTLAGQHPDLRYTSMVEELTRPNGTAQPPRPGARVWNHQLVELAVVGLQPGDDPEAWAALAHDLRRAALHHAGPTTLPWPLHLAQLVGEYIVPIELIEDIENEEDLNAPG
jgi:hypothetical protein